MGQVIPFPSSTVSCLELEEVFDFGSVGDLTVTLVREAGNEDAPLTLAILSEDVSWGLHGLMAFKPEGRAVAELVGDAVVRALRVTGGR